MIVDGRAIAAAIKSTVFAQIQKTGHSPRLGIIACDPNFETKKYLELKEQTATSLGIQVATKILPASTCTAAVVEAVVAMASETDGVIVQLPMPLHIDRAEVLRAVSAERDVDAFSYAGEATEVLPPVVGAIREISTRADVTWRGANVVIFGSGQLVGRPAAHFARAGGATVVVVDKDTPAEAVVRYTREADIIILGVGQPGLLRPDMVSEGVVVFDAGASEDGGVLVGDADPEVAHKAKVFTPVPGGIGPIAIALIFRNLLNLRLRQ